MKNLKAIIDSNKKIQMNRIIFIQLAIIILWLLPSIVCAQTPPHPGDESLGGGSVNNPIGGGSAPLDGGLIIFILMSISYGIKKLHIQLRQKD